MSSPLLINSDSGSECAPHIKHNAGVCSTKEAINRMKKWLGIDTNVSDLKVIELAKNKTKCGSESCLYPLIGLSNTDLDNRFNPQGPYNSLDWLTNKNIDDVLDKHTMAFPNFVHVPFQMIDFKKYNGELSKVNWQLLINTNKDSLGCVVNTDVSTGPGQHWVAIFVDLAGKSVEYFDSAGQNPQPEIIEFLIDTAATLNSITEGGFKDICVTRMRHQKKNTECGVYSLFYIISRLNDVPYRFFEHTHVPDEEMEAYRKSIFRHS